MIYKSVITFLIFNISILFGQLNQKNPWIYTNNPEPAKENITLISIGPGGTAAARGDRDDYETFGFKYAFLSKTSNTTYSGYSISGWSGVSEDYNDWNGWDDYRIERTSFLFAYSQIKALTNKEEFKGLYSGYDIGLTFQLGEEYPLGLTLEPISAFFDSKKRSNIGLGLRYEIGYALNNLMISAKFGIDIIGDNDFVFIDGISDMFDRSQFSLLNLSYKF